MRVVLQRVAEGSVSVEGKVVGEIGRGLLLLVGFGPGDDEGDCQWMAEKVAGLRVFADEEGRMNRSLIDVGGEALVVSQFTLYGDCRKGRRPSFVGAADPDIALVLYQNFIKKLQDIMPQQVQAGQFGAAMDVTLVNEGPVTLVLEH
ncbi:MAG: D-aminoacyl-tRNA deacylase [Longimicrobiales bacterium]